MSSTRPYYFNTGTIEGFTYGRSICINFKTDHFGSISKQIGLDQFQKSFRNRLTWILRVLDWIYFKLVRFVCNLHQLVSGIKQLTFTKPLQAILEVSKKGPRPDTQHENTSGGPQWFFWICSSSTVFAKLLNIFQKLLEVQNDFSEVVQHVQDQNFLKEIGTTQKLSSSDA